VRREGKKVGNVEGLTKERGKKSDIEEKSYKWEGTSKTNRTITQLGCKSKYKERKKERKKERTKRLKAGLNGKASRIYIKGRRNMGIKKRIRKERWN